MAAEDKFLTAGKKKQIKFQRKLKAAGDYKMPSSGFHQPSFLSYLTMLL